MRINRLFTRPIVLTAGLVLFGTLPAHAEQQPERDAAAATGCDVDSYNRARAEFERLKTQESTAEAVSEETLRAASDAYLRQADRCYHALYANATRKIDDGGLLMQGGGPQASPYFLPGLKWGAGSPFPGGQDGAGPRLPGGTITYSFIGDGVSLSPEVADANLAITSLPAYQPCFRDRIRAAFAAWSIHANIQFLEVADNGVPFNASGAAGDIRIGAHTFDGLSGTLAHAYYPPPNGTSAAGDIHFDREENWGCAHSTTVTDIGIIALHEVGHAIGLGHEESGRVAVMNPVYNGSLTALMPDDIDGAQAIYRFPPPTIGPITGADLFVDLGSQWGLWVLYDGDTLSGWVQLHTVSPKTIVTGDLDGNGLTDLIADFDASGIWVRMNNTNPWQSLHAATANRMVTGDLDGNGQDELIVDFPGHGLWIRYNNDGNAWVHRHPTSPTSFVTGDLNGNGKKELIIDFAGSGIWAWRDNAFWLPFHQFNSDRMVVGDFDGNGLADVIVSFPGLGIWNYANDANWSAVHWLNPAIMAAGDLDGDGKSDFVGDFGKGIGVWKALSGSKFAWQLDVYHEFGDLVIADINGNGRDEVIAFWVDAGQLLVKLDAGIFGSWVAIQGYKVEGLAAGHANAP